MGETRKQHLMSNTVKFDLRLDAEAYEWLEQAVQDGRVTVERKPVRNGRKARSLHHRYMKNVLQEHINNLRHERDGTAVDAARD